MRRAADRPVTQPAIRWKHKLAIPATLPAFAAATLLLVGCAAAPEPASPGGAIVASTAGNELVRFNAGRPQQLRECKPLRGLREGERVLGIGYRVARGELYALGALGTSGQLYKVDLALAQAAGSCTRARRKARRRPPARTPAASAAWARWHRVDIATGKATLIGTVPSRPLVVSCVTRQSESMGHGAAAGRIESSVGVVALFTSALGLQPPRVVEAVKLDVPCKRIDFEVNCSGAWLNCPACGAASQPVHDRLRGSWRHLGFFQFEAWLHADGPRVACRSCGKSTQLSVPWARSGSGFTDAFEALALALCRELQVRQAVALLRCQDRQPWRRIECYVDQDRAPESFKGVQIVGVDETSLPRGQHCCTFVHDLEARRPLFGTEGRHHQTVLAGAGPVPAPSRAD